ncbi:glycosyltransferase [Leptolyngbya sp. PCC 6406]|uniref:glycosyltransferase n=1 Tax=Leptolyngbya sp. PCC 6406 TaxID=1173264 RepID=UPI0002AC4983|nr:hypothetical protein [Leptolyngbya sp. PCC 6406]
MNPKHPSIYFWLPADIWPHPFPEKADTFITRRGFDSWVTQTYLRLREAGFDCQKANEIPDEGIIIAYRDFLPYDFKPNPRQLCVCIKGDKNPNPYAQIHITHNLVESQSPNLKVQSITHDYQLLWGPRYYIPHWPQPGLIPRDLARGERIENIAYYGNPYNLAPELRQPQWNEFVQSLGMNWIVEQQRDRWHDYRQVDIVVAVRSFTDKTDYPWKPASKLFNSWRAETPAILGVESAFQGERKSHLDYLEVRSCSELKNALKRLKDDPTLYRAMQENGRQRAQEIEIPQMVARWQHFLLNVAVPAYEKWCSQNSVERHLYFLTRTLALKASRVQKTMLGYLID